MNSFASEMRGFEWVYTLKGVPYHHGQVHTTLTPAYPTVKWDNPPTHASIPIQAYSEATFFYIPALSCRL